MRFQRTESVESWQERLHRERVATYNPSCPELTESVQTHPRAVQFGQAVRSRGMHFDTQAEGAD